MAIPHGERCFCDSCVTDRAKAKIAARDRKKDADAYVKLRAVRAAQRIRDKLKKETKA